MNTPHTVADTRPTVVVAAAADKVPQRVLRLQLYKVGALTMTPQLRFAEFETICVGGYKWKVGPRHTVEIIRRAPASTVGTLVYSTPEQSFTRMLRADHGYYDVLVAGEVDIAWDTAELVHDALHYNFGQ